MEKRTIRLAEDTLSRPELESLADWIQRSPRLTKGEVTLEFEAAFASYIGTRHAVMVNSGSSANLLLAYALLESGRLANNRVVVPAVSWITTLSPFLQLGCDVRLCDSDPQDLGVCIRHLEEILVRDRPALLILVHVLGHPNKMDAIRRLCDAHGCLVVEDSCEALGSTYRGRRTGALSLAGTFSLYYGHHISTIEGGVVTTDDDELRSAMVSLRSHGWSRDLPPAEREELRRSAGVDEFQEFYTFYRPGFNLRSTDLNAFLGLGQLRRMPEIAAARERNHRFYRDALEGYWCQESEHSWVSSFAHATFVANRAEVARRLAADGIECRPLVCGSMGRQPFWIRRFGATPLPVADRVHQSGLYLPNHANLSEADIERVARVFREVARPL
jgi:CDP-6-deoxy-D-xylo-4-hexulose-3-dehydrase